MMMNRLAPLLLALTLVGIAAPASTQESADSLQEVRLVDGSTFYGVVIADGDPIRLRMLSGDEITIARSRIRSVEPAKGTIRDGEVWREDPNLTRLFFAPTARTMTKGHGYVAGYELVFPFVAFAPTDHLLLAGGTPLFGDLTDDRVFYFAPKLNVWSQGQTNLAIGGFFFHELGGYSDANVGAFYAALTQGSPDAALTLVLGTAYDEDGFIEDPVAMLGGEYRVSRTIKLITENYLASGASLFTFGPRFFGERLSADLGIGVAVGDSEVFTVPIVNFVYVW